MSMKIDKFIKKVNKNDRMFAEKDDNLINIYDDGGTLMMKIPDDAMNWLEIHEMVNNFYGYFGKASREYLSAMIEEFLHTPIEERFPEKKYTVQVFPRNNGYLNLLNDDDFFHC